MSPAEINIAIQQACGPQLYVIMKRGLYYRPDAHGYTDRIEDAWKLPLEQAKKHEAYADRDDVPFDEKVFVKPYQPANYFADLNAMHEAEKVLTEDSQWDDYDFWLCRNAKPGELPFKSATHASAAQRAEAFLRTLNLWKE